MSLRSSDRDAHAGRRTSVLVDGLSEAVERFNFDVPNVEDVFNNARGPTDAFNRSLAAKWRRVVSVDADPDGTITINTTPKT